MKYIRTKEQIIAFGNKYPINTRKIGKTELWGFRELTEENFEQMKTYNHWEVINQADTIEELCDMYVIFEPPTYEPYIWKDRFENVKNHYQRMSFWDKIKIYGAIWTDKGLIYVAKMNNNGELELL